MASWIRVFLAFASTIAGVFILISCMVPHQLFQSTFYNDLIWKILLGIGLLSAGISYLWIQSRFYKQ